MEYKLHLTVQLERMQCAAALMYEWQSN